MTIYSMWNYQVEAEPGLVVWSAPEGEPDRHVMTYAFRVIRPRDSLAFVVEVQRAEVLAICDLPDAWQPTHADMLERARYLARVKGGMAFKQHDNPGRR